MGQGAMKRMWSIALATVLCLGAANARAFQAGGVDSATVGAITLTDAQKAAVDKLVNDHLAGLGSDKPAEVMLARRALLDPMMTPQVQIGTGYRIQFGKIVDGLKALLSNKPDENAINALVIAGEIGTQQSAELLIEGLKSSSASVRRAAAYGMQRTFLALQNHQPAMYPAVAESMVKVIGERLAAEPDPQDVLALVAAGVEASHLRGENGQFNLGNAAIEAVCKGMNARASVKGSNALDAMETQAAINAIGGARDLVGGRGGVNVPNEVQLAAAELAGSVIGNAKRVVEGNGLGFGDAERRHLTGLACDAGVVLAGLAGDKLQRGTKMPEVQLGEALRKGDKLNDGVFLKGCGDVLDALSRAPFNFPAGRFK